MEIKMINNFDKYAFSIGTNPVAIGHSMGSKYGSDWTELYMSRSYFKTDPVALIGATTKTSGLICIPSSEMRGEVYEEAASHGASADAVVVSTFGGSKMIVGGITGGLSDAGKNEALKSVRLEHRKLLADRIADLSDRQFDVLDLAESGHNTKGIAANMGISVTAVNGHKATICERLSVTSWDPVVELYSRFLFSGI